MGIRPKGLVDWGGSEQASVHLTPQEHAIAIAQLVVQELTNRETASRLFIAQKTVQYHLTRIYAKFNIRSRTELARVYQGAEEPSGTEHLLAGNPFSEN